MILLFSYSEKGDHAVNEDVFDVRRHPADPDCWLCFVADGQGGRAGGERAAGLACQAGAAAQNKRLQNLPDRQAKAPPVGSGFAQFVPFANKLAYPWTVLAMSDGVWKYVGWDRLIAAAGNPRAQPLIDALKSAAGLRSGCFPDDFTVVVF